MIAPVSRIASSSREQLGDALGSAPDLAHPRPAGRVLGYAAVAGVVVLLSAFLLRSYDRPRAVTQATEAMTSSPLSLAVLPFENLGADATDDYLAQRTPQLFGAVIRHLDEAGEARSATEIEDHFRKNYGIECVTGACEYLADQGLIGKVPLPVRLTKKSHIEVQELAFFHSRKADDVW